MTRIAKAQKLLGEYRIDALVVDKPIDLFYLTGQELSLGRLVIGEHEATLFVDGRYFEGCQKKTPCKVELTTGFEPTGSFYKQWSWQNKRVGFDALSTSYSEFENLKTLKSTWVPLKNPIGKLRELKEPSEIELLRRAAALGSSGMDYVLTLLKEGITEKQVAKELEIFWLKAGAEGLAFTPHIAFGEGSSEPHYHVTDRALKKDDAVLVDIGVVLDHYHSDMTRVFFFGTPPEELEKIYSIVHEAFDAAIAKCSPGVKIGDVDRAARGLIESRGYGKCFSHGLGHGVGLEIHEAPRMRSVGVDAERALEPGMVITIEPGIYVAGLGGVRLEDTIAITSSGHENLTQRPLRRVNQV